MEVQRRTNAWTMDSERHELSTGLIASRIKHITCCRSSRGTSAWTMCSKREVGKRLVNRLGVKHTSYKTKTYLADEMEVQRGTNVWTMNSERHELSTGLIASRIKHITCCRSSRGTSAWTMCSKREVGKRLVNRLGVKHTSYKANPVKSGVGVQDPSPGCWR